ncbi:hypothetical protein EPN42_10790 [bacterium]|nr:MAG: hypothetical protein EPN42_10790 [bacterium]
MPARGAGSRGALPRHRCAPRSPASRRAPRGARGWPSAPLRCFQGRAASRWRRAADAAARCCRRRSAGHRDAAGDGAAPRGEGRRHPHRVRSRASRGACCRFQSQWCDLTPRRSGM